MFGCRAAPLARHIGLATALAMAAPVAAPAQEGLTAVGTEFVLTTPDGRTLRSADLVGATLNIAADGKQLEIMIGSVEEDRHSVRGRVLLHHFLVRDDTGRQVDMCAPDADGRSLGSTGMAALTSPAPAVRSANAFAGGIGRGRSSPAARRSGRCTRPASTWHEPITAATAARPRARA
jgi:hypothetical protein